MPVCHKCPWDVPAEIQKYKNASYHDIPCSKCVMAEEPTHSGQTFISLDAMTDSQISEIKSMDQPEILPDSYVKYIDAINVLRYVFFVFVRLTPIDRNILCRKIAGDSFREIAGATGQSVSSVHLRFTRMMQKLPHVVQEIVK